MCYATGMTFCDTSLTEKAETYIKLKLSESKSIIENDDFYQLTCQGLEKLISIDSLPIDELSVFDAVMKWVSFDEKERVKHISTLLPLIRFSLINSCDLCSKVLDHDFLKLPKL